ncbi:MAG TPA: hypothetical protein VMM92_13865, partial [Thermoanaerobaculia bacterium]|nr:hypothetical protein [Thermoanaerobaculia bacterium]
MRPARQLRQAVPPALIVLLLLLLPLAAIARPGGGQSYSGGGHSGGHGGGGGGGLIGFLLQLWIELVFSHPLIGIPLTILIIVYLAKHKNQLAQQQWDSAPSAVRRTPPVLRSRDLESIRALDPDFSIVLFEDFAYDLYARAHEARGTPAALEALAPYLSTSARQSLAARPPVGVPVSGVVVGALRVAGVSQLADGVPGGGAGTPAAAAAGPAKTKIAVLLEYESNVTVGTAGAERTLYLRERWRLVRDASVRSKPPEQVGSFHCPNCGAPFTSAAG